MVLCGALLTGCVIPRDNDNEVGKILDFMEKTYPDDDFEYVSTRYGDRLGEGHTEIIMTSRLFPEDEILGFYSKGDGGKIYYEDNYLGIKYREQKDQKLEETVKKLFDGKHFNVFPESYINLNGLAQNGVLSFEDFLSSGDNKIVQCIVVDIPYDSFREAEMEKRITEVFKENGVSGTFYFDLYSDPAIADLKNSESSYLGYENDFSIPDHSYKRVNCYIKPTGENRFEWYEYIAKEKDENNSDISS
jgi:hypothetical protein